MRIATVIFAGSVAAFAHFATPVLAKNSETQSDAQKTDAKQAASPCRAYQKAADGSWQEMPCQEMGAPAETKRKSATGNSDQRTR
ncbi:hypothetical protein I6F35_03185 [Bradyrhizobium sp. BRP22]|uniref:hypothetical protein n=1 Tax=Bradyrhizobium sp. BRP22 TaxID=2793821 RepID=UPI001CD319AF|nr:hypothetical protein [Bradyrhizobium sp. BRP22]MCA1452220.1 hypothetical protein [Bradyrhizobium sp. BRP22]